MIKVNKNAFIGMLAITCLVSCRNAIDFQKPMEDALNIPVQIVNASGPDKCTIKQLKVLIEEASKLGPKTQNELKQSLSPFKLKIIGDIYEPKFALIGTKMDAHDNTINIRVSFTNHTEDGEDNTYSWTIFGGGVNFCGPTASLSDVLNIIANN